jgi:hypothetical protein
VEGRRESQLSTDLHPELRRVGAENGRGFADDERGDRLFPEHRADALADPVDERGLLVTLEDLGTKTLDLRLLALEPLDDGVAGLRDLVFGRLHRERSPPDRTLPGRSPI